MPFPDSPLAEVMREYARTSLELRRGARSHAYAAGPIVWGTLAAFAATLCWGVGLATGTMWPTYLALLIELPALMLLTFGVSVLGTAIGMNRSVDGFAALTPRRWRWYDQQTRTIEQTIRICPWLDEYCRGLWSSFAERGGPETGARGRDS